MAAALNACGYDEGLDGSAPVRKRVRDEMNAALQRAKMRARSGTRFASISLSTGSRALSATSRSTSLWLCTSARLPL